MGCWNETCAISRIAIRAGESVRLLPIVQNPFHIKEISGLKLKEGQVSPMVLEGSSGCYIGDLWTPLCFPIRGTYNDYGSIENVPDKTESDIAELEQFIGAFKKNCIPLELGENRYHDTAMKNFTLEEILEGLQEGRCFMNYQADIVGYKDRVVPIAWMMIKESVWQSLLKTDIRKSKEFLSVEGEPDRVTPKGIRKGISDMLEKQISIEEMKKLEEKVQNGTVSIEESKLLIAALSVSVSGRYYRSRVCHNSPFDLPELNKNLLDVAVEMEYIHSMMSLLRISFQPTTGSGSQCDNTILWKLVNKNWTKLTSDEIKKRKEEERKSDIEYKKWVKAEAAKKKLKKLNKAKK